MQDMPQQSPGLEVMQTGKTLRLKFNRPERKNALTLDMYAAAADALIQGRHDSRIRVLLLQGTGDCFSAGNDLADFMEGPEISDDHPVMRFMHALQECSKPVVASVSGPAVGIGTTLLLHCDLVYASEDAYFQLPFVNLGLCPEFAVSYLLPRMIGHAQAAELLLLGEPFNASRAQALGLVNDVLAKAELKDRVDARLARLASQPPAALRRTKALLKQYQQSGIAAAMNAEMGAFAEGLASPECKEAVTAFFEKRAPDFSRFE